nr:unnamed protein product [Digitaria exilis]
MAPVTATRVFYVSGHASSDGFHFVAGGSSRRSAVFNVGGYDWSIHYYRNPQDWEKILLCLQFETKEPSKLVTASFGVSILDPTGTLPPWKVQEVTSAVFDPNRIDNTGKEAAVTVSMPRRFQQDMAPDTRYFTQGSLLFGCTITVFTDDDTTPATAAVAMSSSPATKALDSDMMEQLGKIYATKDGSDVTYSVKGKLFHTIILAMRSPVFKAQLYGGMMESTAQIIEVEDMQPEVFDALLHYIYTDTLPCALDDDDDDDEVDEDVTLLISHLLVALGRYGIERLKILCQCKLCDLVSPHNWVKMVVFAEEQRCDRLKDACIQFMATSGRAGKVVVSEEYAQLRRTHPLILIDVLEKINEFRENMLNPCFREMKV